MIPLKGAQTYITYLAGCGLLSGAASYMPIYVNVACDAVWDGMMHATYSITYTYIR